MRKNWLKSPLNSCYIGTIKELKVAIDLFNKGWDVFKALSLNRLDLMAMKYDFKIGIEVKTAHRNKKGEIQYVKKILGKYEYMALVTEKEIIYIPEIPDIQTDMPKNRQFD